jgi:hypothetical protein
VKPVVVVAFNLECVLQWNQVAESYHTIWRMVVPLLISIAVTRPILEEGDVHIIRLVASRC